MGTVRLLSTLAVPYSVVQPMFCSAKLFLSSLTDINLQDLAWIIVKSRPGLLYAILLISQPSASHAITTGNDWRSFWSAARSARASAKLQVGSNKPLPISSPGRLKLPRRWLLVKAPPLLCLVQPRTRRCVSAKLRGPGEESSKAGVAFQCLKCHSASSDNVS